MNLLGSVAQWGSKATGERTNAALDYKAKRGEWHGRIPYGFKINHQGVLVQDPEKIKNIQKMKEADRRGQ